MKIRVTFYSYFKDLTGCSHLVEDLPEKSTLGDLFGRLAERHPKLAAMEKSTLMAVGVEYRSRSHPLQDGDEVALFPPVQGG